jgi:hypothetical protein
MKVAIGTVALLFVVQAPTVSANEEEWLKAHNDRRNKYHTTLNKKTVVNLEWSSNLAALAKTWAEGNVATCENRSGIDNGYGRSAAMRQGTTTGLTAEWTLANWEKKVSLGYPSNGAFTQAIWRPTKYVGCYIATSTNPSKKCQSAVCYYAKPGNCSMGGAYGTTSDAISVWNQKVFADDSNCPADCPPEGCPIATIQADGYAGSFGVIRERTSDVGGGQNVGSIETGDWMYYQAVTIPITGTYRVSYRVAALNSGGSFQLERAGGSVVYGRLSIPATGGYQTWTTIRHTVNLSAGSEFFGILSTGGGWNINWFTITKT